MVLESDRQLGLIARFNVIVRLGCAVRSSNQFTISLGYNRLIELLCKTGLPLKWLAYEMEHLHMLQHDKFGTS
jgi:hypothetical protein